MANGVPVSALLPNRLDSMADRVRDRMSDHEEVGTMKLAWGFIGTEVESALKSTLDCDLLKIFATGWAQAGPLVDLADAGKHPPGERSVVELGKHDLSRELQPVVAITLGTLPTVELNFALKIAATIGGVRLSVLDQHIIGGDLGEVWASAQLSYEGAPLHPPTESSKIAIPAEFRFDLPGVRIAGHSA